ncbi:MAG TPA: TfoX/Sxy family DNA transformation protein [Caulobacterales bacterium]|jgi:DNA transformation protein|nr:TfoX/Sxy family DNA transformation protein [Caulobacterales bacterium]
MSAPDPKGLAALRSLGKTTAHMLIEAGVPDPAALRRMGAVEAWRRLRLLHGRRVTASFLYALEAGVTDTRWSDLTPARLAELKAIAGDIARRQDGARSPERAARRTHP